MLRLQCVQGLAKEEGEGGPGEVCLTIAAAAVPEAAEVRLLEDPVGFAAALHIIKGQAPGPSRSGCASQSAGVGDQDWIDRVLRDEKPSIQHLVGRRNRACSEARMAEHKRLEGARMGRQDAGDAGGNGQWGILGGAAITTTSRTRDRC